MKGFKKINSEDGTKIQEFLKELLCSPSIFSLMIPIWFFKFQCLENLILNYFLFMQVEYLFQFHRGFILLF